MSHAINRKQGFLAWLGGLRGQLIVGVALVHAVMMTLFIWDLTERQQSLLLQRQTEQARTLAESLSVSSAGWLASRDVAGLQEIIDAQQGYAELEFAMILDRSGRIMAHSDQNYAGRAR
jgi:sensor histidine kinase regulating citrate/malate metabolism